MQNHPGHIQLDAIRTQPVQLDVSPAAGLRASMLRLDGIHPQVSGNKWFKLRFYLDKARSLRKKRIVTWGGAWSNHILATAAACNIEDIPCAGIIRGERPVRLSPVLREAESLGMSLYFISRTAYAGQELPAVLNDPDDLLIPAGGYGSEGAAGAGTLLDHCANRDQYTHIICACGTGTMLAGLSMAAGSGQELIGISVLKNHGGMEADIHRLADGRHAPFHIIHDFHFGGYARYNAALIDHMNQWYLRNGVPTDFVYTGKLCYAVDALARAGYFPSGSRLLLIHSGGLGGNASLKKGTLIF